MSPKISLRDLTTLMKRSHGDKLHSYETPGRKGGTGESKVRREGFSTPPDHPYLLLDITE